MNRRKFLSQTGKYALATAVPYILPTGRLFALTEDPKVKHVVFCLFAGGIRRWESTDQKDGNLMPNTLRGENPISGDIRPGIDALPKVLPEPLQRSGTLLKGFRYNSAFTHHYPAHESAISGRYYYTNEMFQPIKFPSVFEYFRKHSGFGTDALKTWWVADKPGDYPYIQYSKDPDYGWPYAANMIQPSSLFKFSFSPPMEESRADMLEQMIGLIRDHRPTKDVEQRRQSLNTNEAKDQIRKFIKQTHDKHFDPSVSLWNGLNNKLVNQDLVNMFTACEILKTFHPHLLVVNMQDSDIGHFNFTQYCNNLHKADYALAQLWKTIQEDPILKDNTVLIAQPEFGRNKDSNTIMDEYGRLAIDHSGDDVSQQAFCLIAGPPGVIHQNKVVERPYGETIDTVPTIAHLLGFENQVPEFHLPGKVMYEALV